jgi:hypothetical protein
LCLHRSEAQEDKGDDRRQEIPKARSGHGGQK